MLCRKEYEELMQQWKLQGTSKPAEESGEEQNNQVQTVEQLLEQERKKHIQRYMATEKILNRTHEIEVSPPID